MLVSRWSRLGVVVLLVGRLTAEPTATVVVSTSPAGASLLVDGIECGLTPATVSIALPGGATREVRLELRLANHTPRLARVVLGPGETLVWTQVTLLAGGGEPVMPSGLATVPALTPSGFPPANWPDYLATMKPLPGARYRVSAKDLMPQVLVPAGEFTMGSTPPQIAEATNLAAQTGTPEEARLQSEGPAHAVRLSAYWMDLHEVTNAQYCRFLNEVRPSSQERQSWVTVTGEAKRAAFPPQIELKELQYQPVTGAERHPVSYVTWHGAVAYATWAGRRLPTEAEWERAARAGVEGRFWAWAEEYPPAGVGNLADTTHTNRFPQVKKPGRYFVGYDDGYEATAPVASFQPNALGLYDLMGNLWEWCQDTYDAAWYAASPKDNPLNPSSGAAPRVLRGGAFLNAPWSVRPAVRLFEKPEVAGVAFGFRCVASPETGP